MSKLKNIQDTVQKIANALAAALKFDIEIVDSNLEIIAVGGELSIPDQKYYYKTGVVNRILFQKNPPPNVVILNPGKGEMCKGCERYGLCSYKNVIYSLIESDGEVLGAMGIATRNPDVKEHFDAMTDEMERFIEIMTDLLSSKAKEYDSFNKMEHSVELMNTVLNNVDKGVVSIDMNWHIISINDYLCSKLGLNKDDLEGQSIRKIFPDFKTLDPIYDNEEMTYEMKGKKLFFMAKCTQLKSKTGVVSYALFLDDVSDVNHLSYALLQKQNEIMLSNIQGEDIKLRNLKAKIKSISSYDSTVLLCGETGTGKELFARSLHYESNRSEGPFVSINCGAIPEALIESELFGYDKGTFTGANKSGKHGKFFLADKGTILLDEVENMPLHLQQKLLRVIERKEIERIGSIESIAIDVRIVAATNVPLETLVERKQFREDLFHRLNVFTLKIPPLRERGSDILLLSSYFINLFNQKFHKNILGLTEEVKHIFKNYGWKGNVRELQNTIEYALYMEDEQYIKKASLPYQFDKVSEQSKAIVSLEEIEHRHISKALDYYGWSEEGRLLAAKDLGISRSTIYRKIKKMTEGKTLEGELLDETNHRDNIL